MRCWTCECTSFEFRPNFGTGAPDDRLNCQSTASLRPGRQTIGQSRPPYIYVVTTTSALVSLDPAHFLLVLTTSDLHLPSYGSLARERRDRRPGQCFFRAEGRSSDGLREERREADFQEDGFISPTLRVALVSSLILVSLYIDRRPHAITTKLLAEIELILVCPSYNQPVFEETLTVLL